MPGAGKDAKNSASEASGTPGAVRGRKAIDSLFRSGRRVSGEQLAIVYRNLPDGDSRCSVFVPRRLGNPVKRNRARRVLREYVRTHPHNALSGREMIVFFRKPVSEESIEKARNEIGRLLDRIVAE